MPTLSGIASQWQVIEASEDKGEPQVGPPCKKVRVRLAHIVEGGGETKGKEETLLECIYDMLEMPMWSDMNFVF